MPRNAVVRHPPRRALWPTRDHHHQPIPVDKWHELIGDLTYADALARAEAVSTKRRSEIARKAAKSCWIIALMEAKRSGGF